MATIKAYTNLEQSRKLVEILSIKGADMCYEVGEDLDGYITKTVYTPLMHIPYNDDYIPCWSLSALFGALPKGTDIIKEEADTENEHYMCTVGIKDDIMSTFGKNPIDAAYSMILKLKELNLL